MLRFVKETRKLSNIYIHKVLACLRAILALLLNLELLEMVNPMIYEIHINIDVIHMNLL